MDTQVHGANFAPSGAKAPRIVRWCVLALEALFAFLILYQVGALLARQYGPDAPAAAAADHPVPASSLQAIDQSLLRTFDPFFRGTVSGDFTQEARAPESTLKIEVFGLRTTGEGHGNAIVKMQDGDQRLVKVGDAVAPGITLAGVYADRLEISRAGGREAIYLRPQSERTAASQAPAAPDANPAAASGAGDTGMLGALADLKLEPVRRERRIIGFRLPEDTPFLLTAMGLEAGDILLEANGAPLTSFERIGEIGEELKGARRIDITIERRGETRRLSLDL